MSRMLVLVGVFVVVSCSTPRLNRYQEYLEPRVGVTKKSQIDRYGKPVTCTAVDRGLERCEYRTPAERNGSVPTVYKKAPGFGPDVSAYEYFDVLYLYYDSFGVLQEWEPVVLIDQ